GEEDEVAFAAFGRHSAARVVLEPQGAVGRNVGMAPGGGMISQAANRHSKMQLLASHADPSMASGMRAPGRSRQQLHLLCHHERPELAGKALDKVLVGEHAGPMLAAIRVVLEFPKMDQLVDGAGVSLEVADQLLVVPALLKRRKAQFLVEPARFRHLADIKRI